MKIKRSNIVDSNYRIDNWEKGKGRKNVFMSMVERKHTDIIAEALIEIMLPLKMNIHSITLDNVKTCST